MSLENTVPPNIVDLCRQMLDKNTPEYVRYNLEGRLQSTVDYIERALKDSYERR